MNEWAERAENHCPLNMAGQKCGTKTRVVVIISYMRNCYNKKGSAVIGNGSGEEGRAAKCCNNSALEKLLQQKRVVWCTSQQILDT